MLRDIIHNTRHLKSRIGARLVFRCGGRKFLVVAAAFVKPCSPPMMIYIEL